MRSDNGEGGGVGQRTKRRRQGGGTKTTTEEEGGGTKTTTEEEAGGTKTTTAVGVVVVGRRNDGDRGGDDAAGGRG